MHSASFTATKRSSGGTTTHIPMGAFSNATRNQGSVAPPSLGGTAITLVTIGTQPLQEEPAGSLLPRQAVFSPAAASGLGGISELVLFSPAWKPDLGA